MYEKSFEKIINTESIWIIYLEIEFKNITIKTHVNI